ncbi:MAG: lamin tail domain-containing protein [bacterium]|nr:lamin tail domain-containing protein [bacterium]
MNGDIHTHGSGRWRAALGCLTLLCALPAAAVVINELHYNPAGSEDVTEFIEFYNSGAAAVALGGWTMSAGVDFTFPAGALIPAQGYLVLAQNLGAFAAMYPGVSNVYGPFANGTKLDNAGERVALSDNGGGVVCEVTYRDDPPWPTAPDGNGPSLELQQPLLPPQLAASWAASKVTGGTPGARNSTWLGETAVIDQGSTPAYPPAGQSFAITAIVLAPTNVTSLTLYYHTNQGHETSVIMADDGLHQDGSADDRVYGAVLPAFADATCLYYYYRVLLANGSAYEYPVAATNEANSPWLLLRLSSYGLETQVAPRSFWQTISTTGVATSSRLYAYLGGPGEILLDDVTITLGATQYVRNGSFTSNAADWTMVGNHSGAVFDGSDGNSAPGCLRIVATGAGDGSPGNHVRCDTSPALTPAGPVYTLSFAYRAPTMAVRDWYTCAIGATNWQVLHINEVLPWNATGITDEDGATSDWIEIYNSGTNAMNLYGVGLSDADDDPFLWRFPDCVIEPHGFLLVYASGKNRTTPRLHTNFKLDAQGETLSLTVPSGLRIQHLTYGPVPADVSRGSVPDGGSSNVYFTTPTPAGPNTTAYYLAMTETPQFSRPGGFFSGTLALTISVQSAGAQIRYTLDNSTPTAASTLYTNRLNITATTYVKARAFCHVVLVADRRGGHARRGDSRRTQDHGAHGRA